MGTIYARQDVSKQDFLTVQEAADILRVHPNTIYNWIHIGFLKAHKVGRAWRIPKEGLLCLSE